MPPDPLPAGAWLVLAALGVLAVLAFLAGLWATARLLA